MKQQLKGNVMGLERMSSNIDQRDYPVYSITDNINSTFIP